MKVLVVVLAVVLAGAAEAKTIRDPHRVECGIESPFAIINPPLEEGRLYCEVTVRPRGDRTVVEARSAFWKSTYYSTGGDGWCLVVTRNFEGCWP